MIAQCVFDCVNSDEQVTTLIARVSQHNENPDPLNRFQYVQIVKDVFTISTCKERTALQVNIVNKSFTICTYLGNLFWGLGFFLCWVTRAIKLVSCSCGFTHSETHRKRVAAQQVEQTVTDGNSLLNKGKVVIRKERYIYIYTSLVNPVTSYTINLSTRRQIFSLYHCLAK